MKNDCNSVKQQICSVQTDTHRRPSQSVNCLQLSDKTIWIASIWQSMQPACVARVHCIAVTHEQQTKHIMSMSMSTYAQCTGTTLMHLVC